MFDKNTLQYIIAKNPNEFELLAERLSVVDIVIPMRLDDNALHQKINATIAQFQQDGTIDALYKKWIFIVGIASVPKFNLDGRNGTLKMGTCLLSEPYAFMSNGAMAALILNWPTGWPSPGVRLEISDMSYDAMIAALQVGKIDLAIANFYKVEERQKACEFSTPYIRNDISAMVRRQKP